MNVLVKYLLSVLLFSIVVSCSGVKVYTDYDKDININDYQTFQWLPFEAIEGKGVNPLYYNELNDKRIKAAVDQQLLERGFKREDSTVAQLVLHYHIILESKATPITLDSDEHQYSAQWSQRNVDVYQYTEGTLIIDLMDQEKDMIVWRGWIVGVVDASNIVNSEESINKAVDLIFDKFPD